MRKYLLVILFISFGFGQDVLILKKGASYEGEFLGIKSGKIHFQPTNVSVLKPRRLNEIRELTQSGQTLIQNGKWLVDKEALSIKSEGQNAGVEFSSKDEAKRQFSMNYQMGIEAANEDFSPTLSYRAGCSGLGLYLIPLNAIAPYVKIPKKHNQILTSNGGDDFRKGYKKELIDLRNESMKKGLTHLFIGAGLWFVVIGFEGYQIWGFFFGGSR